MIDRKLFLTAVFGSGGVQIGGAVFAFLVGVLLARSLGIVDYGLYGTAMAVVAFGATFASGGIQLLATLEVSKFLARNELSATHGFMVWSLRAFFTIALPTGVAVGLAIYINSVWPSASSVDSSSGVLCFVVAFNVFLGTNYYKNCAALYSDCLLCRDSVIGTNVNGYLPT